MFETIAEAGQRRAAAVAEQPSQPGQPHAVHRRRKPASCRLARVPDQSGFESAKQPLRHRCRRRSRWPIERRRGGGGREARRRRRWAPSASPCRRPRRSTGRRAVVHLFQVSVPTNWTAVSSNNVGEVRAAERLWRFARGQTVLTHGVELGVARASSRDLREATDTLVRAFVQGNPDMRRVGRTTTVRMSSRSAIGTPLVGRSALGGERARRACTRRCSRTATSSTT